MKVCWYNGMMMMTMNKIMVMTMTTIMMMIMKRMMIIFKSEAETDVRWRKEMPDSTFFH